MVRQRGGRDSPTIHWDWRNKAWVDIIDHKVGEETRAIRICVSSFSLFFMREIFVLFDFVCLLFVCVYV